MGNNDTAIDPETDISLNPDEEPAAQAGSLTIHADGEPVAIDQQTTVADLKDIVNAAQNDLLIYWERGEMNAISGDDEPVANHVSDGDKVAFQPIDKGSTSFG